MTPEHDWEVGRCLFREANDGFVILHPADLRLLDVNPAVQRLTGLRRKQLLERSLPDLLEGDDADALAALLEACRPTGYFAPAEGFRLRRAGGPSRPVHVSASRIHVEPEPLGLLILRDVSRQKLAEDALRASETRLRQAVDAAQLGTWEWDPAADRLSASPLARGLHGLADAPDAVTLDAFLANVLPADRGPVADALAQARDVGWAFEVEYRVAR